MTDRLDRHTQPFKTNPMRSILPELLSRVCVVAALVDVGYLAFFWYAGSPVLTWINLISIALYALAFHVLRQRKFRWGALLIWLEAFPHAAIGVLMLGWDSGFQYLLLMFVPAVVMTGNRAQSVRFVVALLVFLASLLWINHQIGPLAPIAPGDLHLLGFANFTWFVLMFSWTTYLYQRRLLGVEKKLQAQATTDSLTGLFNRRHFLETAERTLAQASRAGHVSCIAILDLDHFKAVNDRHGHHVGDAVLQLVSAQLQSCVRLSDVLARWGGEEFVILMPSTEMLGALDLLERVRQRVHAASKNFTGAQVDLTVSAGVALIAPQAAFESALTLADHALYRSKHSGRNQITVA